jgi:hypothetical protein
MKALAMLLVLAMVTMVVPGCATTGAVRRGPPASADPDLMRDYVKHLPIGAVVLARLEEGHTVAGVLMKVTDDSVTLQPRVRIPEPPVVIRLEDIVTIELDQGGPPKGQAAWLALVPLGIILLVTALTSGAT